MTVKRVPVTVDWTQTGSSSGLLSARPSASVAGAGYVYTATDTGISYVSSGTDWFNVQIDTISSASPSGSAGGDLTGSYPNPTITAGAVTDTKVAAANKDGASGTASMRTLGTGSAQAAAGNDSRLSDARTPTAHKTSHETGGSDALSADVDANARVGVRKNSAGSTFKRRRINLIEGTNVTLTVADDSGSEEVDVTIASSGDSGDVATDTIWDAKGDLAVGTGADTASKLAVGSDGEILTADSTQTTGTKWAAAPSGGPVGRASWAAQPGLSDFVTLGTTEALAAVSGGNGGAIEVFVVVPCPMYLEGYGLFSGDTASARSAEARLYLDSGSATCSEITNSAAAWSFTPSAASLRRVSVTTGAPITLSPGGYWLVLRNTSAAQTFGIRRSSSPTFALAPESRVNSIAALSSSVDLDTGWTLKGNLFAIWLEGRVLGRSTVIS